MKNSVLWEGKEIIGTRALQRNKKGWWGFQGKKRREVGTERAEKRCEEKEVFTKRP